MTRVRRRLPSPRTFVWAFVAMLLALRLVTGAATNSRRTFTDSPLQAGPCEVVQVVAADILVVRQPALPEPVTVQLVGIAAANREQDGDRRVALARQFTLDFLVTGPAQLGFDNHRLNQTGHSLVYIDVAGRQLNEALLTAGQARFVPQAGNAATMNRRLADAQREAQRRQLGIWSSPPASR